MLLKKIIHPRKLLILSFLGFFISGYAASPERNIPGSLHRHSIGWGVGQTFLMGDFGKLGEDKITLTDLFYSFSASHSFDLLANFHFSKHKDGPTDVSLLGLNVGIKARLFEFDDFSPFILGGVGFYRPQVTRFLGGTLTESEAKTVFGLELGGGADLKLSDRFSVGLMLTVNDPFDVNQDGAPDVEGFYCKFLVTGFYTFP